jgi:hypothetical protein
MDTVSDTHLIIAVFAVDEYDMAMHEDYFPEEPLVRKEKKVGRNDPCPCGSGKKYKNCCLGGSLPGSHYITAHEHNYQLKKDNVTAFSVREIREMSLIELQDLDVKNMTKDQAAAAFKTALHSDILLALHFLVELRRFYEDTNGILPGRKETLRLRNRKITLPEMDDAFDNWIMDAAFHINYDNRLEFAPRILKLFFNTGSNDYKKVEFLCSLYRKNTGAVLDYIEQVCVRGIEELEEVIALFYTIRHHYPGIAVLLFRAVTATSPERFFDIETMHDDIMEIYSDLDIDYWEDPALAVMDLYQDLADEDDDREPDEFIREEMQELKKELREAHAESAAQKKKITLLQNRIQSSELHPQRIHADDDAIKRSREKIAHLKQIISTKQVAVRDLRAQVRESQIQDSDDQDLRGKVEEDLRESEMGTLPFCIPVFPEKFQKSLEMLEPGVKKKAVESFTGFCTRSREVFKQTKKLKTGGCGDFYSIRLGIHHRLIINCSDSSRPIPLQVIQREDLETAVKNIKAQ